MLIIGAGAAGLTAALAAHASGAKVTVIEKGARLGGTAAISGGIIWAANNPQMKVYGMTDSREEALDYFGALDHGEMDAQTLAAFIDEAPQALAFLEDIGAVRLKLIADYPDYYLDRPGAKSGGRTLDNELFDYRSLGAWADKVYHGGDLQRLMLCETPLGGGSGLIEPAEMQRRVACDLRGWGQALVGRLLKACLDRDIRPFLGVAARQLLTENSRISGAAVENITPESQATANTAEQATIRARRAVILATGGFEWAQDLKAAFLRGPLVTPASPPGNTGDGLKMAMRVGAGLGNMTSAWWMPTLSVPGAAWSNAVGEQPRHSPVLIERTLPHTILVNRQGKRFCNEANNYSSLAGAFQFFDPASYDYPNLPAFLIFDEQYRSRYPIASVMPGDALPDWIASADSLEALASRIGLDKGTDAGRDTDVATQFLATVAAFNAHAAKAQDPQFGRGLSAYDRFYGDRSRSGAAATLGTISTPPYYAVAINIGALGTNGGPRTNASAQILDVDGAVIVGLFGAGNVISCPTGSVYAGAGGTLGPALTFGFIAGRAAAGISEASERPAAGISEASERPAGASGVASERAADACARQENH